MKSNGTEKISINETFRNTGKVFRVFAALCWFIGFLITVFGLMLLFGGPFEEFKELARHITASGGTIKNAVSEVFSWAFVFFFVPVLVLIMLRNADREIQRKRRGRGQHENPLGGG